MIEGTLSILARIVQACAGFLLGTVGASTPVAVMLICFAVLLVGPGDVLDYLEHLARLS